MFSPETLFVCLMITAAFPGSFDPPTLGHINIIERAAELFDELVVIVAENPGKKYLFSPEERAAMLENLLGDRKNVSIVSWSGLIVEFLKERGIRILIRGIRGSSDLSCEFELSLWNKALAPKIETIFLTTDPRYQVLRSSGIREVAAFGGNIDGMVPPGVAEALREKFRDLSRPRQGAG
jgi:pantetheine-phosphate adenylyltransferase